MLRLNLGSGATPLEGFENWDILKGRPAFPLALPDDSVDELRASHILEHFSHKQVLEVLADWVRVLKPGGMLRIAVPDLSKIVEGYKAGIDANYMAYLMGGHVDEHDYHRCVFDRGSLEAAMRGAGLVAIHPWRSEVKDCAALDISLNLAGWKRTKYPRTIAIVSHPRHGPHVESECVDAALTPLGIQHCAFGGAFWEQCWTRGVESLLALPQPPVFILSLDYDTAYSRETVEDLLMLACAQPDAQAIAPLQLSRGRNWPLFVLGDSPPGPGVTEKEVTRAHFARPLVQVSQAHFGCTLLTAAAFAKLPRPWMHSQPAPDGGWGDGRLDADIDFWRKWRAAGNSLYLAPRVVVGHLQEMIVWPDEDMQPRYQYAQDFHNEGMPDGVWK
jgi:SAM-dependent methyltransferase